MRRRFSIYAGVAIALLMARPCWSDTWEDELEQPPWRVSLNGGGIIFEGD